MGDSLDVARRFGANLRRVRRQADLSQEQLGFHSGLHRTEVGLLERGARVPRIDTLLKVASALEVSPDELIEGIEWTPGSSQSGSLQALATFRREALGQGKSVPLPPHPASKGARGRSRSGERP